MEMRHKLATFILVDLSAISVSQPAYDDAGHSVYNDGWQTGDNGGYGWAQWNHFFFTIRIRLSQRGGFKHEWIRRRPRYQYGWTRLATSCYFARLSGNESGNCGRGRYVWRIWDVN